jgi:purine-binding chemotaxis protein CheW
MKNVLIFGLGDERYSLELRWVREIFTMAALTPVPTAPAILDGVVNFKGAIVPVLSLSVALGAGRRALQPGDTLVLIDVDGTRVALGVDRIDAVTALATRGEELVDDAGTAVPLVDAGALVAAARQQIEGDHGARA